MQSIQKTKLLRLKKGTTNALEKNVIDYVLDSYTTDEEINCFFDDLSRSGCVSGMVSSLIYYSDTTKFYDDYEEEIEDLVREMKDSLGHSSRMEFIASMGSPNSITEEKNLLAWFAFEETARQIYDKMNEMHVAIKKKPIKVKTHKRGRSVVRTHRRTKPRRK